MLGIALILPVSTSPAQLVFEWRPFALPALLQMPCSPFPYYGVGRCVGAIFWYALMFRSFSDFSEHLIDRSWPKLTLGQCYKKPETFRSALLDCYVICIDVRSADWPNCLCSYLIFLIYLSWPGLVPLPLITWLRLLYQTTKKIRGKPCQERRHYIQSFFRKVTEWNLNERVGLRINIQSHSM